MLQSQDYPCTCQVKPYSGDTDVVIRESLISSFYSEVKVEKLEEMIEKLKINQSKLESDLENSKSTESDLVASQQKTEEFDRIHRELILELNKNQTKLASELEDYNRTDAELVISQRKLNDCNAQLKDVIEGKQVCQNKYEMVCPWSEWSSCSKPCWGTKTRINKCSSSDEQIKSCNQFSSCRRSGK